MTPTQFIIIATVVILIAIAAWVCGYKSGREDEREEAQITKRQRARRLMVVHTARAFCGENGKVITQGGLPSQNRADWFNASRRAV